MMEPKPNIVISKTILIIDDDNYLRATISNLLLRKGYNIISYSNPNDAINYVTQQTQQPDLILMDYIMEPMTGLDAADILKRNHSTCKIPIIIMSANYLECNYYPFIQKPISSEVLISTIHTYLTNLYI